MILGYTDLHTKLVRFLLKNEQLQRKFGCFLKWRSDELTKNGAILANAWIISYSKFSNWGQISKLSSNLGCLFTFCYLDGANSIKTDLHIFNLWTSQFVSYKFII